MNRYINADELLDRFCGTYECDECESYNDGKCTELVSFKKIRYIISRIHTADVAEVVRCEDCRHWNEIGYYDSKTHHVCPFFATVQDANGFCHYGERKEE